MPANKKSLREAMQARLLAQSAEERLRRSLAIQKKLWALPAFKNAGLVLFFASMPEEVNTHVMIDLALHEGLRVALPCSDLASRKLTFYQIRDRKMDLRAGVYGIMEPDAALTRPVAVKDAGLVIVPGVVFDRSHRRIGHGAGFYDRLLAEMGSTPKIGVAYSFQVTDEVPQEIHDVALDDVITD